MIDLYIDEYCHNCPYFEAHTDEHITNLKTNFIITCEHSEKCRAILQYIKENVEKRRFQ